MLKFLKTDTAIIPPSSAEIPFAVALNSSNYSIFENKSDYQRANSRITDTDIPVFHPSARWRYGTPVK